jgi:hypothetical protein
VFAGVPGVDRLALDAGGGLGAAVGADQLAVNDDVRPALLGHLGQGVVQVGGLGGEHREGLVAVAVGGRAGHPEPSTDDRKLALGAHPHQHQQRLAKAGQQARPLAGAPCPALGAQQPGQLADQFTGDIEDGRIGDQRGVLGRLGLVEENSLPRTPRPSPHPHVIGVSGPHPADLVEITSVPRGHAAVGHHHDYDAQLVRQRTGQPPEPRWGTERTKPQPPQKDPQAA